MVPHIPAILTYRPCDTPQWSEVGWSLLHVGEKPCSCTLQTWKTSYGSHRGYSGYAYNEFSLLYPNNMTCSLNARLSAFHCLAITTYPWTNTVLIRDDKMATSLQVSVVRSWSVLHTYNLQPQSLPTLQSHWILSGLCNNLASFSVGTSAKRLRNSYLHVVWIPVDPSLIHGICVCTYYTYINIAGLSFFLKQTLTTGVQVAPNQPTRSIEKWNGTTCTWYMYMYTTA